GDGLITALQVLAYMQRKQGTLSELTTDFVRYPQILVNVRVAKKKPIEELPEFLRSVEKVESALEGHGRVLVRYSGTEPLARIMVEGDDEKKIGEYAEVLADELRRALGG
ncbi:MAG: phosphoglucosamine mutase, partial [Deltaproteobacteria bacterium]|nr:phosphoglucosamine mutase [Deltaproteobacteria bacterium]